MFGPPLNIPSLLVIEPDDVKPHSTLLRTPHYSVQIIQLSEAPPPSPRRRQDSMVSSSSYGSSSSSEASLSSSPTSEYDDSQPFECDQEESEQAGSSYCSSDLPPDELEDDCDPDETFSVRMKRVCAWRDHHSLPDSPILPHSKHKIDLKVTQDDSNYDSNRTTHNFTHSHISLHSCPACDASFSTPQNLRQHGRSGASDACIAAVEYAFE